MKNRLLSIFFIFIITLSLAQDEGVSKAELSINGKVLKSVDVNTASSPLGGQTLSDIAGKSIVTSSYASYYTVSDSDGYWVNSKKTKLGSSDRFINGATYYYTIVLKAASDYEFSSDIQLSLSGPSADVYSGMTTSISADKKTATFKNAYKVVVGKGDDQISIGNIVLSKINYYYNGKAHKPAATVYDTSGDKVNASGYTLTYSKASSKKVGVYTVTATGKTEYQGEASAIYKINPSVPKNVRVSSGKKSIKVSWKAPKSGKPTYYDIYLYTNSKCSGTPKHVDVSGSKLSRTISHLKSGKTYYVKVACRKKIKYEMLESKKSGAKKVKVG